MREAVGGSLMLYLIIPLIVLMIFFVGFIIDYASSYRAANYVVSQIEYCQGPVDNCKGLTMDDVVKDVKSKYHYYGDISTTCITNGSGAVYRVELPVEFELPLFGRMAVIKVKAETKTIMGRSCS